MLQSFGFEWTALSKQSRNACHSVGRPLNLFVTDFGNLARISTFEAAVAPFQSSPDWGLKLTFPVEVLGVEVIGVLICRNFRVESMRTTAHVISSVISLASATSCMTDSSSFSSFTSSQISLSRLFKVSSFYLSVIFCCESLSCSDGAKLAIESSTCARSLLDMCTMTSADFPLFLEYLSHCCPKIRLEGPCNEFIPFSDLQQLA